MNQTRFYIQFTECKLLLQLGTDFGFKVAQILPAVVFADIIRCVVKLNLSVVYARHRLYIQRLADFKAVTAFDTKAQFFAVRIKFAITVVGLDFRFLYAAVNRTEYPVCSAFIAIIHTKHIAVDVDFRTQGRVNLVALAAQVIITVTIRCKQAQCIVFVILQIKAGIKSADFCFHIRR